ALPSDVDQIPVLKLWDRSGWEDLPGSPPPHISTKLAWLGGSDRVVYESVDRRLTAADLPTARSQVGPAGSNPAAAPRSSSWFAVVNERVAAFPPSARAFELRVADGFRARTPTSLRSS